MKKFCQKFVPITMIHCKKKKNFRSAYVTMIHDEFESVATLHLNTRDLSCLTSSAEPM